MVSSTGHQGSHIFSSFSLGNCFIVLEREARQRWKRANGWTLSRLIICSEGL